VRTAGAIGTGALHCGTSKVGRGGRPCKLRSQHCKLRSQRCKLQSQRCKHGCDACYSTSPCAQALDRIRTNTAQNRILLPGANLSTCEGVAVGPLRRLRVIGGSNIYPPPCASSHHPARLAARSALIWLVKPLQRSRSGLLRAASGGKRIRVEQVLNSRVM
jgi:hypothetical protein